MSTRTTTIRSQRAVRNGLRRKSGFTVLEVLVAMFVLLVGGLAILNIFPPALSVIRGSESREIAIAMTQSTLERYSNEPATIPDAVYNDDNTGVWFDSGNAAVAGTRIRNSSLPRESNETAFDASALSDAANFGFRRIVGEKHRVLDGTGNTRFVLTNFANNGNAQFFVEENVLGVTTDVDGNLIFQNARLQSDESQSLADTQIPNQLADGLVPLGSTAVERNWFGTNCQYYVSYRWKNGTEVNGVEDEKIAIASATPQLFQGQVSPVGRVVAGEISMRVRIPVNGNFTPTSDQAAVGYLPLPGTVGNYSDALGRPVVIGDEVSVDYTVSNWRQLIYDSSVDVPTSKPGFPATARDVKLPVSALGNQPLYALLFDKTNNGLVPQTGVIGQWSGSPLPPVVDVNAASATLNVPALSNPQARVAYQTSRGWAQQVSVAAKNYYPFNTIRTANEVEAWREYFWQSTADGGDGRRIFFKASEAGKTALVTFRYAPGNDGLILNQVVPISSKIIPVTSSTISVSERAAFAPSGFVSEAVLSQRDATTTANATAILSVRGASIRSRTAWIEGKNYVQEIKEDYRPLTD